MACRYCSISSCQQELRHIILPAGAAYPMTLSWSLADLWLTFHSQFMQCITCNKTMVRAFIYTVNSMTPPTSAAMHLVHESLSQSPPSFWHSVSSPPDSTWGHCPMSAKDCHKSIVHSTSCLQMYAQCWVTWVSGWRWPCQMVSHKLDTKNRTYQDWGKESLGLWYDVLQRPCHIHCHTFAACIDPPRVWDLQCTRNLNLRGLCLIHM